LLFPPMELAASSNARALVTYLPPDPSVAGEPPMEWVAVDVTVVVADMVFSLRC
jgi:hypothetical protein